MLQFTKYTSQCNSKIVEMWKKKNIYIYKFHCVFQFHLLWTDILSTFTNFHYVTWLNWHACKNAHEQHLYSFTKTLFYCSSITFTFFVRKRHFSVGMSACTNLVNQNESNQICLQILYWPAYRTWDIQMAVFMMLNTYALWHCSCALDVFLYPIEKVLDSFILIRLFQLYTTPSEISLHEDFLVWLSH